MKCTLAITQSCNLSCSYCYIEKKDSVMKVATVERILDFIFNKAQKNEKIEIGFFGGEPLLEFELIKKITDLIKNHQSFDKDRVTISITTNGTILSKEILDFIKDSNIVLCISCDGPSHTQDAFRHFSDGRGSSKVVENNIKKSLMIFPLIPVNAVYSPENLSHLGETVEYLCSLGVRNIYLNPDIFANWTEEDAKSLPYIYGIIGKMYIDFYNKGEPKYISLIDSKIAVILRGGYKPMERCRMGVGEFAFAPSGNIYPCERLIGSDDGKAHCIGNINKDVIIERSCGKDIDAAVNSECLVCGLKEYCMNWCGCTNYYSTGSYNRVAPFICASEKAAISTAFQIIQDLGENGLNFTHHMAGSPLANVISEVITEGGRENPRND